MSHEEVETAILGSKTGCLIFFVFLEALMFLFIAEIQCVQHLFLNGKIDISD